MFKFSVMSLFGLLFLASASESAIIIAGDLDEAEQEKVNRALRTYTGPAPGFLDIEKNLLHPNMHNILLNKDIPFAEVEFIKAYLQKENINATVAYVPSTIWNLHVIHKYLTEESAQQNYNAIHRLPLDHKDYFKAPYSRYFSLSKELMDILSRQEVKGTQYFTFLATNYLKKIEQNKLKENDWSRALGEELQKIETGSSSILHKMITEEFEAGEKNKILLVRATNGLELKDKAGTREEYKNILQKFNRLQIKSRASNQGITFEQALEELLNEQYNGPSWHEDFRPHGKVIDFPLSGSSAWGAIADWQLTSEEQSMFNAGKDLSYADSFLAGYLYDSFNRPQSACSFVYYAQNPAITLYSLHLDKAWVYSKGVKIFHFLKESLETDGIFGSQEGFHPRLRKVSRITGFEMPMMTYQVIDPRLLAIDSSLPPTVFGELTPIKEENIKIFQYMLQVNEVISQARVVYFNGKIVDIHNSLQDVNEILKNQKYLSTLLQEKVLPGL